MELKRSDTTRFILPLIGLEKHLVITEYFIGSYLRIEDNPEMENCLILVYTSENRELKTFAKHFQTAEQHHVYIVENNGILRDAINKFIDGRYSLFTVNSKHLILKFWNLGKRSQLARVLFPNTYMLEQGGRMFLNFKTFEVWRQPDMDKETFKFAL